MSAQIIPFPIAALIHATRPQRPAVSIASIGNLIILPVIRVERQDPYRDDVRGNGE